MSSSWNSLKTALLSWEQNTPRSLEFDDRYFALEQGPQESKYVFLEGNDLPTRWQGRDEFTIAELGFGTGLNFLATRKLWKEDSQAPKRLTYISFEKHPMSLADLKRAHSAWPEFENESIELRKQLPPLLPGFQCAMFDEGRLTLLLGYGDANELLPLLVGQVDAWFLDGFAPAKNEQLWNEELLQMAAKCSRPDATVSSFSSASAVRRSLDSAGFDVSKKPGFGSKREMLTAKRNGAPAILKKRSDAIIIGGGLAGSSTAHSLSKRGISSTLIERAPGLASQASGNAAGVLMPLVGRKPDRLSAFALAGFEYSRRHFSLLKETSGLRQWSANGVVRLTSTDRLEQIYQQFSEVGFPPDFCQAVDAAEASEICGLEVNRQGLFYPRAGWVSPPEIVRTQCKGISSLSLLLETEAISLERKDDQWRVLNSNGQCIAQAPQVIIANSIDALQFEQTAWLPLQKVRGQVLKLPVTDRTKSLKTALCFDGYIIPEIGGSQLLGASYERNNSSTEIDIETQEDLISRLERRIGQLSLPDVASFEGRVSFRATTPDKLPIVGRVPNTQALAKKYYPGFHHVPLSKFPEELFLEGLYCCVGFGSHGLSYCPLSAQVIVRELCDEPQLLGRDLLDAIQPIRFPVRMLKRGEWESKETEISELHSRATPQRP